MRAPPGWDLWFLDNSTLPVRGARSISVRQTHARIARHGLGTLSETRMGQLQQLFDEVIHERATEIVVEHIVAKCAQLGIDPTARQRRKIVEALSRGKPLALRQWRWPPWRTDSRELVITDEDLAAIAKEHNELLSRIEPAVRLFVNENEERIKQIILRSYPSEIRSDDRELSGFRRRLAKRWERPATLLRIIIALSERIAVESAPDGVPRLNGGDVLEPVLRRLHGRGVRIAKEALALIEAGFADGAMARWRTLHEITVVAMFIQDHGAQCATLYLAHDVVETYRSASSYRAHQEALGYEPITDEEWHNIEDAYRAALATYGESFATEYGWARSFLVGRAANFAEIEASIALEHLRPFYKMASQQVHAGPKAILFGLSHDPRELVLLGPSNAGLADPGQNVGLTLSLLTKVFLRVSPDMDVLVGVKVLSALASEAAVAWAETQRDLDEEQDSVQAE